MIEGVRVAGAIIKIVPPLTLPLGLVSTGCVIVPMDLKNKSEWCVLCGYGTVRYVDRYLILRVLANSM
jgi:hypothetical protein